MKLITLNLEFDNHLERVTVFLDREQPEILCLQEVPESFLETLKERNYHTLFLPMTIKITATGENVVQGVALASTSPISNSQIVYLHNPPNGIIDFDEQRKRETIAQGFVVGEINGFTIVTTHFTWTPKGSEPNQDQQTDLAAMLKHLSQLPPHILCGDLNIPRGQSFLYDTLLTNYTDTIPQSYKSSLDKNLHRLGDNPEKAIMFSDYMVDYVFTQPPNQATNVRLEFGVSDHAAVIAEISSLKQEATT